MYFLCIIKKYIGIMICFWYKRKKFKLNNFRKPSPIQILLSLRHKWQTG